MHSSCFIFCLDISALDTYNNNSDWLTCKMIIFANFSLLYFSTSSYYSDFLFSYYRSTTRRSTWTDFFYWKLAINTSFSNIILFNFHTLGLRFRNSLHDETSFFIHKIYNFVILIFIIEPKILKHDLDKQFFENHLISYCVLLAILIEKLKLH